MSRANCENAYYLVCDEKKSKTSTSNVFPFDCLYCFELLCLNCPHKCMKITVEIFWRCFGTGKYWVTPLIFSVPFLCRSVIYHLYIIFVLNIFTKECCTYKILTFVFPRYILWLLWLFLPCFYQWIRSFSWTANLTRYSRQQNWTKSVLMVTKFKLNHEIFHFIIWLLIQIYIVKNLRDFTSYYYYDYHHA